MHINICFTNIHFIHSGPLWRPYLLFLFFFFFFFNFYNISQKKEYLNHLDARRNVVGKTSKHTHNITKLKLKQKQKQLLRVLWTRATIGNIH